MAILLVPGGTVDALYCWRTMGDPLKFVHVQSFWGRKLSWPWEGTLRAVEVMGKAVSGGRPFHAIAVANALDLMAVGFALVMLIIATVGRWRLDRQSWYLLAFGYADLLLLLVSPIGAEVPLHGATRYVLEILPAFLVLARMGENRHVERLYLLPTIATRGLLVLAFLSNIWVG